MFNNFLGPTLIVITFNIFVIITLLRKVYVKKGLKVKKPKKSKKIFSYTSLTINLGITWILFLLYVHKWSPYFSIFSYAFIVFNGLQVSHFLFYELRTISFKKFYVYF